MLEGHFPSVNISLGALALLLALPAAQNRNCLRVMPIEELTRNATLIARVRVVRVDKVNYFGLFSQIARLRTVDVIEGDFMLKEVNVFAQSNVRCADDGYSVGQEWLVFLAPEGGLFHTLNYQHGRFLIIGDTVKAWRDKSNKESDKPYAEVRKEIEEYIKSIHTPPSNSQPQQRPPQP